MEEDTMVFDDETSSEEDVDEVGAPSPPAASCDGGVAFSVPYRELSERSLEDLRQEFEQFFPELIDFRLITEDEAAPAAAAAAAATANHEPPDGSSGGARERYALICSSVGVS